MRSVPVAGLLAAALALLAIPSSAQSLAELAAREKERRSKAKNAGKVYTESDLGKGGASAPAIETPTTPRPQGGGSGRCVEAGRRRRQEREDRRRAEGRAPEGLARQARPGECGERPPSEPRRRLAARAQRPVAEPLRQHAGEPGQRTRAGAAEARGQPQERGRPPGRGSPKRLSLNLREQAQVRVDLDPVRTCRRFDLEATALRRHAHAS